MSAPDLMSVLGVVALCAAVVGGLGAAALFFSRRRSLTVALGIVALVPLLVAVAGTLVISHAMFLDTHDLKVLVIVLGTAAFVGAGIALLLGRSVSAATRALSHAARSAPDAGYVSVPRALPSELARIDAALIEGSAALRDSHDRERALERSRRELVAWVSHDLRTPISGIRAMSEALADGVVDDVETTRRYADSIRREAERLSDLVDDLFELSRIHADALLTTVEQVALWDVLAEALDSAKPVAAAKGVRIEEAVLAGMPPVAGSSADLLRVVRNLLANAIRHTPTDGVIAVRAGAESGTAWFEVADSCGGIPEEDLPRVFDVAFRGTNARTPGAAGGGLGLAIARGLVEAHGGGISVENAGPGCRVMVRIPSQT